MVRHYLELMVCSFCAILAIQTGRPGDVGFLHGLVQLFVELSQPSGTAGGLPLDAVNGNKFSIEIEDVEVQLVGRFELRDGFRKAVPRVQPVRVAFVQQVKDNGYGVRREAAGAVGVLVGPSSAEAFASGRRNKNIVWDLR